MDRTRFSLKLVGQSSGSRVSVRETQCGNGGNQLPGRVGAGRWQGQWARGKRTSTPVCILFTCNTDKIFVCYLMLNEELEPNPSCVVKC